MLVGFLALPLGLLAPTRPPASAHILHLTRLSALRTFPAHADGISEMLAEDLTDVRGLRPSTQSPEQQKALWEAAGLNPTYKVSGIITGEPSFTRLFDHQAWMQYTGKSPIQRWIRTIWTWRFSTVLAALWPICLVLGVWAYLVASIPPTLLPRTSPIPMSLMGSAIGLLLVFRTNNTYARLNEARLLWGRAVFLCREVAQTTASALFFDETLSEDRSSARASAAKICRYLAAWAWETNAKLTGPSSIRATMLYSDDVLKVLLPEKEASYLANVRSRPVQLLGLMRRTLQIEYKKGRLPYHLHLKLESDVAQLGLVVGGCERLFSSPVPPTMSRHVVRCLVVWLLGLPVVLAGTMAPRNCALWVACVTYIFVGIEEVGVQVEQPFEIVPMTQLCNVIMLNLEEAFESGLSQADLEAA